MYESRIHSTICLRIRKHVTLITSALRAIRTLSPAGHATHRRRFAYVRQTGGQPKEACDSHSAARPASHSRAGGSVAAARRSTATLPHAIEGGGIITVATWRQYKGKCDIRANGTAVSTQRIIQVYVVADDVIMMLMVCCMIMRTCVCSSCEL